MSKGCWEEFEEEVAQKFDDEKLMFNLLDPYFTEGIVAILTLGAKKYAPNQWQGLDRDRIEAALGRHINEYMKGNKYDHESHKSHLYHAACNLMFLDWFDRKEAFDRQSPYF